MVCEGGEGVGTWGRFVEMKFEDGRDGRLMVFCRSRIGWNCICAIRRRNCAYHASLDSMSV